MLRMICAAALAFVALASVANARAPRPDTTLVDVHGISSVPAAAGLRASTHGRAHKHRRHRHHAKPLNLIRVQTDAGLTIEIDADVAPAMQGFIADLVRETGYRPRRISCYSTASSHVAGSNHFWGGACDFDQRAWNKTHEAMYSVRHIARRWGLRDGCVFGDCGHIDKPRTRSARR